MGNLIDKRREKKKEYVLLLKGPKLRLAVRWFASTETPAPADLTSPLLASTAAVLNLWPTTSLGAE